MTAVAHELGTAALAGKCRCEVRGAVNCTAGRQRVRELPPGGPGLRPLIINTDVSQNRNASGGAKHGISSDPGAFSRLRFARCCNWAVGKGLKRCPLPHTFIPAQSRKILTDVNSFGHHANTRETHDAGPWAP